MAELVVAVDVNAPPVVVFDALTDWPAQRQWMPGTSVRVIAGDGRSQGSRISARTAAGPLGFEDPMEITGWDAPRRCQVHHLGRIVKGDGSFEVEPLADGRSRFVWSEWLDLPLGLAGQVGFVTLRPGLALGLKIALRRFAAFAEARA